LEVFNFLEFFGFVASEESESGGCFEKDQHLDVGFYYYNEDYLYLLDVEINAFVNFV
jgi:hypothetical protein